MAYDYHLDDLDTDRYYFRDQTACALLADRLHAFDVDLYELKAFCIRPNHVHLLISLANQTTDDKGYCLTDEALSASYVPLSEIMQLIKGGSARIINQYLGKSGTLWQKDSYDHYVRNAKAYDNILYYILENPQKAGLVRCWKDYPFTYYV